MCSLRLAIPPRLQVHLVFTHPSGLASANALASRRVELPGVYRRTSWPSPRQAQLLAWRMAAGQHRSIHGLAELDTACSHGIFTTAARRSLWASGTQACCPWDRVHRSLKADFSSFPAVISALVRALIPTSSTCPDRQDLGRHEKLE